MNAKFLRKLPTPKEIKEMYPLSEELAKLKEEGTSKEELGREGFLKEDSTRERELLTTAAYYHDIGKIDKPLYFSENQSDEK